MLLYNIIVVQTVNVLKAIPVETEQPLIVSSFRLSQLSARKIVYEHDRR